MTIVVAGEALIDLTERPGDLQLTPHAGGGPYNTARTLARLGEDVCFLGALSGDAYGTLLRERLSDDGVDLRTALVVDAPTTLALARTREDGSAQYEFYVESTSAPALDAAHVRATLPDDVTVLHVGTLGLVLEPMAATLRALVASLAGRALVMVDPNCRPALIGDRAAYRARLEQTVAHADVVKASVEDLAWLGDGAEPLRVARELRALGPELVMVTDGGAGVTLLDAGGERHVPAPPAAVVDTIGAGDSFSGGFLAHWRRHGLDRTALANRDATQAAAVFACAVAAKTCERAGADPPTRAELDV